MLATALRSAAGPGCVKRGFAFQNCSRPTVTDTNVAISEYFCCSASRFNLLAPVCNVGRPSASTLSPLPAGVLPDELYCVLGAGFSDRIPPRETAWHIDPSTGRSTPYQWSVDSQICLHDALGCISIKAAEGRFATGGNRFTLKLFSRRRAPIFTPAGFACPNIVDRRFACGAVGGAIFRNQFQSRIFIGTRSDA